MTQFHSTRSSIAWLITAATCIAPALAADLDATTQEVTVRFGVSAAGQPLRCDSAAVPLGRGAQPTRLHDARWYAYDFALVTRDGRETPITLEQNEWQRDNLALVDLEGAPLPGSNCDASSPGQHEAVTGRVPAGDYTGLVFHIGVPGQLNHSSTTQAAAPLDLTAMSWVWQAGRRFMRVEVSPEGGVAREGSSARHWMLHLGSSGCSGDPAKGEIVNCLASNRFAVRLASFDATRDAVDLDLTALLADVDIGRDGGGAVGCMSNPADPECPPVFKRLGVTEPGSAVAFRAIRR